MSVEAYDFPELDLNLLNIDRVQRTYAILQANYGDGYADAALVGTQEGNTKFVLSAEVIPDNANIRTIQSKTAFAYYWDFFAERLRNGNQPFRIFWRNAYYLVQFAQPEFGVDVLTADLFANGLELVGRRVSGVAVRNDGSLIYPSENAGLYDWWAADYFTDVQGIPNGGLVDEWQGRKNARILMPVTSEPTIQTNQIKDNPAVRTDNGYFTTDSTITVYGIALVLKIREATFSADRTILSALSGGTRLLSGKISSGAKFDDLSISGLLYYYNGVNLPANNMTAPMNTYGIVQLSLSNAFTATGGLTIGFRGGGTEHTPIDIAEIIIFTSAVTPAYRTDIFKYLNAKYQIV